MKNMLIAATAIGAAIAGIILISRRRADNAGTRSIAGAARNAYNTMNKGIGRVERGTWQSLS